MLRSLRISREEQPLAVAVAVAVGLLQVLMLRKYFALLFLSGEELGLQLGRYFHLSGFDTISYRVLTEWGPLFDVVRHPLLHVVLLPLYLLNQLLWRLTGVNCAMPLMCLTLTVLATYSAVLFFRVVHRQVGASRLDATLLTVLFCSMAYILVTFIAPDHFAFTLVVLLATMLCTRMNARSWAALTLLAAGITLTNGAKVVMAAWRQRGRRFWQWPFLLGAAVVPMAVAGAVALTEHRAFVLPKERAQQQYEKEHRDEFLREARANHKKYRSAPWVVHKGRPLSHEMKAEGNELAVSMLRWTDVTTDRWDSVVENLLGESMQFHESHLLEDVLKFYRPVLMHYKHWWHYAVEALLMLLFAAGCWAGRRSPLLWMLLGWTALDMTMHIGLGFAINEVYIMSAHWLFVIPIVIGFLLVRARTSWQLTSLRCLTGLTALYLFIYNYSQLVTWLLEPPAIPPFVF